MLTNYPLINDRTLLISQPIFDETHLPDDVVKEGILGYLTPQEQWKVRLVSRQWNDCVNSIDESYLSRKELIKKRVARANENRINDFSFVLTSCFYANCLIAPNYGFLSVVGLIQVPALVVCLINNTCKNPSYLEFFKKSSLVIAIVSIACSVFSMVIHLGMFYCVNRNPLNHKHSIISIISSPLLRPHERV